MITFTKEWLQQKIADMEEHRDLFPGDLDDDHGKVLSALRVALASIEAEAVITVGDDGGDALAYRRLIQTFAPGTKLYTTPPVPVSVPDERAAFNAWNNDTDCPLAGRDVKTAAWLAWSRRAAMLQGANGTLTNEVTIPANTPCKDAPEHIWLQTAGAWPENGEFSELTWCSDNQHPDDTLYVRADVVTGNSPVIQDGYCIMPLKLTAGNGAKSALCGEFHVQYRIVCQSCVGEGCEDCNHAGGWDAEIPVSWDTIKRIHEAAVEACALPSTPQHAA